METTRLRHLSILILDAKFEALDSLLLLLVLYHKQLDLYFR